MNELRSQNRKGPSPIATINQKRRQRARALAKRLKTLGTKFPEYRHLLEDPLQLLHYQSNRATVLHAIHMGAWTVKEIQRETKLPQSETQRILKALVESQIVFTTTRKDDESDGGRPTILYLPNPNLNP